MVSAGKILEIDLIGGLDIRFSNQLRRNTLKSTVVRVPRIVLGSSCSFLIQVLFSLGAFSP